MFKKCSQSLEKLLLFSFFSNLSRLFHCSVIKVLFVCSRQTAFVLYQSFHRLSRTFLIYFCCALSTFFSVVRDSLFILSRGFTFVNIFFQFFENFSCCRFLQNQNGEGGIWTPAPLLTTCTLSRGVPSASLGTSPCSARIWSRYERSILLL